MSKVKERTKKLWRWLRANAINKEMIFYLLIAELIFWSPCIVVGILAVSVSAWWWTVFAGICAFWAGPVTPAVPLQLGLAVLLKKIFKRKKKMKINTNINLRNRSKVTLKGFKGLDTLSTSVDVNAIHATEMKNLISRDGVNHKRFGWKTQVRIRDDSKYLKIQGIFNFTIFTEEFLLAYAGRKFWWVTQNGNYDITKKGITFNDEGFSFEDTSVSPVDDAFLSDTECKFFINGNKVYFVGCGDYLVFSKWENGLFELRRVVGNEDVYIPTTTENIGSEEENNLTRITAEEKNLLSPYNYNLLFGRAEMQEGDVASYYLDTKDFSDIEVEVMTERGYLVELKKVDGEGEYVVGDNLTNVKSILGETSKEEHFYNLGEKTIKHYKYDSSIDLIKFTDGGFLCLKPDNNAIIWNYAPTTVTDGDPYNNNYVNFYGIYKMRFTLCYKRENEETEILELEATFEYENFKNVTLGETYNSFDVEYTIDFGEINFSFLYENNKIQEILFGKYYAIGSFFLQDKSEKYTGSVYPAMGKLVLNAIKEKPNDYRPMDISVPNIKVKIKKEASDYLSVTNTKTASLFGTQGSADRLFVANENIIRWSKDEDFTYFGDKSWCVCGTADKKINGMERLNDSTLLVTKEYSLKEPSVFVITGNLGTSETEAKTIDYKVIFAPRGYQVGIGAIGEIVNFNGDCLMVAKDGIYAITLGENMTVDARYILHRSRQISNTLEKFDLSKAKCISYNGKFFIAVGGNEKECFVADNKYTASFKGDMQNVLNYEWWRWTNIPVNVWGFVKDQLWFGTEDGQICSFTDNFYDEIVTKVDKRLIGYVFENDYVFGFNINENINVGKGDLFTPNCDLYGQVTTSMFEVVDGETRFYLPLNDYKENETIYIDSVAYQIKKAELYFFINRESTEKIITFYKNYKDKLLIVSEVDGTTIKIEDNSGEKIVWDKINGGLNPSQDGLLATLSHKETIEAYWVSGAMDLGTRAYSKSLTYIVITGEKDLANHLKYGLETRFTGRDYSLLRANNDLDFSKLDWETISLDSQFASSYARKLNLRNLNFLMFYFVSDKAEDIAINSVEIEFKINKRNVGVR